MVLLFLSFPKTNDCGDADADQQNDFPWKSPGDKDGGGAVGTADDPDALGFDHISHLQWDPS